MTEALLHTGSGSNLDLTSGLETSTSMDNQVNKEVVFKFRFREIASSNKPSSSTHEVNSGIVSEFQELDSRDLPFNSTRKVNNENVSEFVELASKDIPSTSAHQAKDGDVSEFLELKSRDLPFASAHQAKEGAVSEFQQLNSMNINSTSTHPVNNEDVGEIQELASRDIPSTSDFQDKNGVASEFRELNSIYMPPTSTYQVNSRHMPYFLPFHQTLPFRTVRNLPSREQTPSSSLPYNSISASNQSILAESDSVGVLSPEGNPCIFPMFFNPFGFIPGFQSSFICPSNLIERDPNDRETFRCSYQVFSSQSPFMQNFSPVNSSVISPSSSQTNNSNSIWRPYSSGETTKVESKKLYLSPNNTETSEKQENRRSAVPVYEIFDEPSTSTGIQKRLPQSKSTQTKLVQCDVCNKTFSKRRNLRKHYRIHKTKKPFVCKKYKQRKETPQNENTRVNQLKQNKEIIHIPHICETCGKKFMASNNLKMHETIHPRKTTKNTGKCNQKKETTQNENTSKPVKAKEKNSTYSTWMH